MNKIYPALLILLLLAGCTSSATDDTGQPLQDRTYSRIISLYAAHTENLIHMGAADKLVGVSKQDDNTKVANLPRFSARDGVEKFLAAKPDLVLMRPMHARTRPALRKALENAGVAVAALQPGDLSSMFEYWETLGRLADREEQAKALVRSFKAALSMRTMYANRTVKALRPRVFFESIHRTMSTFAPSSMPMIVLKAAGGMNAAPEAEPRHGSNIASWGRERLLADNDNIDIFLAQTGRMNPVSRDTLMNDSAVGSLKAAKAGRVYIIEEKLVSRPTPDLLNGINELRKIIRKHKTIRQ